MSPITLDQITEEQANVVPNKTIASRLREVHGTTGETVATAIPGAGPVMYVDTDATVVGGTTHYVLTKTLNEIKQAIDNNIFVVIKRKAGNFGVSIEYIYMLLANGLNHDTFSVHAIARGPNGNISTVEYSTDDPNGHPTRMAG